LRGTAVRAGVRRRFAPHQLRHAHAVELAREGVPLIVIQRQLGHSNLGITSVYLQGIDNAEIIETVHARRQPMIPVSTSLPGGESLADAARAKRQRGLGAMHRATRFFGRAGLVVCASGTACRRGPAERGLGATGSRRRAFMFEPSPP
jgi:hypothetical protein